MGSPIRPFFDHSSPEWPENECRYLESYMRTQAIMHAIVWVSAIVLVIVLAIACSINARAQNTRGVTTKTATEVGATGPESWLGDALPAKVKVSADVSKATACQYRLDIWDGNQRAWVPGTADKPCISAPETVTLSSSFARVFITQLTGSVTFTLDSSQ